MKQDVHTQESLDKASHWASLKGTSAATPAMEICKQLLFQAKQNEHSSADL